MAKRQCRLLHRRKLNDRAFPVTHTVVCQKNGFTQPSSAPHSSHRSYWSHSTNLPAREHGWQQIAEANTNEVFGKSPAGNRRPGQIWDTAVTTRRLKKPTRATLAVCRKILRLAHARAMRYPTVVGHRLLDHARPIYYQTHRARALCYLLGLLRPRHFGFESPHEPGAFAVPHPNSVPPTTTATETTLAKAMPTQKSSFSLGIITSTLKKTKTRCRFLNSANKKIRRSCNGVDSDAINQLHSFSGKLFCRLILTSHYTGTGRNS